MKAISYGKLVDGVDVCKFGKQWVVSMAAAKKRIYSTRSITCKGYAPFLKYKSVFLFSFGKIAEKTK